MVRPPPLSSPVGPTLLLAASLAVVTVHPPVPLAAQGTDVQAETARPGIHGQVSDRDTGELLADVAVTIEALTDPGIRARVLTRLTTEDGRFFFGLLPAGIYAVRIEHLGYRTVRDSVLHRPDLGLRMQVEMAPEAVELEPLVVVTEGRSRALAATGFYERQRRGLGYTVTRDEVAFRRAQRPSDVFGGMPGVQVTRTGRFGGGGGIVRLRGGCVAEVVLDGVRTSSPFPIDDVLSTNDIEAVEVYRASEVPPRFGANNCGLVLIWTRTPTPDRLGEDGWSWSGILVGVGLAGLAALLS